MPDAPAKRRRLRFSLRTLILLILLIPSMGGLLMRWEPWAAVTTFSPRFWSEVATIYWPRDAKRILVLGVEDGRVYDAEEGRELCKLGDSWPLTVDCASMSPDGQRVITSADNVLKIWDSNTGGEIAALRGYGKVTCAAFSPNGRSILVMSPDKTGRILDGSLQQKSKAFEGHAETIWGASYSADGERVVTASEDKTARVWDSNGDKELISLRRHSAGVCSARFSRDGRRIVTASKDGTARIWDANTGRQTVIMRHPKAVYEAYYSPDGERVATVGADHTVRVWAANAGDNLAAFRSHGMVFSIAFSAVDDSIAVVTRASIEDRSSIVIHRRRRPEQWWGVFWLWETWAVMVIGIALIYSLYRDHRRFREQQGVTVE